MAKPSVFTDLDPEQFPVTVTAIGERTGRVVWEETLSEPGALEIPALAKIHGEPITIRTMDGTGVTVETRSDGTKREVKAKRATEPCDAGRTAFFGGKWKGDGPCPEPGRHIIASSDADQLPTVHLCDAHFAEVQEAGLVDEPFINEDEFARRQERSAVTRVVARFNGGPLADSSDIVPLPAPDFYDGPTGRYVRRPLDYGPTVNYDWNPA